MTSKLPQNDTILLTVFLKHDQSMNNVERAEKLDAAGFNESFPPRPEKDFRPEETKRHAAAHAIFLDNFHEQLELHEAELPALAS